MEGKQDFLQEGMVEGRKQSTQYARHAWVKETGKKLRKGFFCRQNHHLWAVQEPKPSFQLKGPCMEITLAHRVRFSCFFNGSTVICAFFLFPRGMSFLADGIM